MENRKISVTVNEPVIKKVSMIEGGKKGMEVVYKTVMFRDGVRSEIEDKGQKHKRPVHKELRVLFKELHKTFLEMCGYDWKKESELELKKGNVSIVSMLYDRTKDVIQLVGNVKVSDKYKFAVTGPMMSMADVVNSEEVMVVVEKILDEAKLFASGVRGMERRDLSIGYMMQKNALELVEAEKMYEGMSAAEQEEMLSLAFDECGLEVVEENGKMVVGVKDEVVKLENEEQLKIPKNSKEDVPTKGNSWQREKDEDTSESSVTEEMVAEKAVNLSKKEKKKEEVSEDFELPVSFEETPEF